MKLLKESTHPLPYGSRLRIGDSPSQPLPEPCASGNCLLTRAALSVADCAHRRFRAATVRERAGVVPHVPHCDVTVLVAEAVFPAASYAMTLMV